MKGGPKAKNAKGTVARLFKYLFKYYKVYLLIVAVCIILSAVSGTVSSLFLNQLVLIITEGLKVGYSAIYARLLRIILLMVGFYVVGVVSAFIYSRLMAIVTQGFLNKMRQNMFGSMQTLPIKYFDTNTHGDIMSHYTNDIDTIRQLISQSIPQLFSSVLTIIALLSYMLYLSVWMTLLVFLGVFAMTMVTKKVGGNSAKYFVKQQKAIGAVEGYIEEMMNGQKVVKVFCHEEESEKAFDKLNEQLFRDAESANKFANILMPIMGNIGNILYVLIAFVGGLLILLGAPNLSFSGQAISVAVVVPFLNMTRQFTMSISQVSQQINSVVMAMAGTERIFELMDESPEVDDGYVTLVNANVDQNGDITESKKRTGIWAWKHPHSDGTVTYTRLAGDVRLTDVDFGYVPEKIVLHNIDIYAEPGQKIAFVGSTGAGKTTITNLINRFYDIADGKIRYDGININKIKKADLRRSLGIVLQDVNLFTGTVMENIRYGRLDATDEECIAAAKLANAHGFIEMLPEGYNTVLTGDGSGLSQGQRQLISIARAAVADPPVMILDEATSSIDTRTEAIVQMGMDRLMQGRTVFVIAHRLSTVQNSDVIMVLEGGRIIERGSHSKLIEQKGTYYQLYTGAFEME
ncbi:MAG: ABC transporter ATP-binding protein [Acutalibacteraceae bacterium]|nr:ABC transporter ATP-binding protein [Acutalibacteraceae bacterium]